MKSEDSSEIIAGPSHLPFECPGGGDTILLKGHCCSNPLQVHSDFQLLEHN